MAEQALAIMAAREAADALARADAALDRALGGPDTAPEVLWVHPPRCYACQPHLRHEHPAWEALAAEDDAGTR